jgi:hypothetical protein
LPYEFPRQGAEKPSFRGNLQDPNAQSLCKKKALPKKRLLSLLWRCDLALDDCRVLAAVAVAEASPARPEDERGDEAMTPTTTRMTPATWMSMPATSAFTAQARIAPTAISKMLKLIPICSRPPSLFEVPYVVQAAKYPEMRGM